MHLDHVAFGGSDFDALTAALGTCGLTPTYGGEHADGSTHMSLVAFPDGSYLELIVPTDGDPRRWRERLLGDAGPCAWAIRSDDVAADAKRAIDAGVPVDGPHREGRARPDGTRVEWDVVVLGDDLALPFAIRDRTPREYRVAPEEQPHLSGVAEVVLAVGSDAPDFERLYRFPSPVTGEWEGRTLRHFPGTPVTLVADPERVAAVGPGPAAFLLGTDSLAAAANAYALTEPEPWLDGRLAWFDAPAFRGRLGVRER
jgi:hypothetical protein